ILFGFYLMLMYEISSIFLFLVAIISNKFVNPINKSSTKEVAVGLVLSKFILLILPSSARK
ncbi:hypothetical protein, partial [Photobacterium profundum]|uniref:hypothetical protein n=1 Tax=Photobacterium profundum TaxID=74109 RepID=UPI003D115099